VTTLKDRPSRHLGTSRRALLEELERSARKPLPAEPYATHLNVAATAAGRFFERQWSVITRAFGSPKMPRTVGSGQKPREAICILQSLLS